MDFIYFTENFFLFFLFVATFFFPSLKDMSQHLVEHLLTIRFYSGDAGLQGMLFVKVLSASTVLGAMIVIGCGGESSSTDFYMLVCPLIFSSMTNAGNINKL